MLGRMTRRSTWRRVAPREAAASSVSASSSASTGWTLRTQKGRVTKSSAAADAEAGARQVDVEAGCRRRRASSSVRPATIVGSAKGRSMTALTSALPRKSSRTSTKAMARPATELTTATMAETASVSSSAATASAG